MHVLKRKNKRINAAATSGSSKSFLKLLSSQFLKVPLTPKTFFRLMKCTSFPDYFSEKIFSIDKIPALLQAFKHAISMFTVAQSGIWVGLLVTSLREPG